MSFVLRRGVLALALAAAAGRLTAQATVTVSVPATVGFYVADISRVTDGVPSQSGLAFADASLGADVVAFSLRADAATFAGPAGGGIAAGDVSWTTTGAAGGTGFAGTLSDVAYQRVFESAPGAASGTASVAWHLGPLSPPLRAGEFTLTVRWKIEAVTP